MYRTTGVRKRSEAAGGYRDGPLPWGDAAARAEARAQAVARGFTVHPTLDEL